MDTSRYLYAVCLLTVALCAQVAVAEPLPRYAGMLSDGTRIHGKQLRDWFNSEKMPHLDAQPLFAEDKPLRWLIDLYLIPSSPSTAFVETITGDRIPGRVIRFIHGDSSVFHPRPSLLEIETTASLKPQNAEQKTIRIDASFVRRIVWQATAGAHDTAKTSRYRDGRRVNYRSLRFAAKHVEMLLPDGVRKVGFDELAEVTLPQRDLWNKYFEMLSTLLPDTEGQLCQIETDDALVVTGAIAELRAYSHGNPSESRNWVHGIQPAWSPDVLWIPNENIRVRRCFDATEVPLSLLHPIKTDERSFLGNAGKRWQVNRNVEGGRLRSAALDFGWGIGVHATSRLFFTLPPSVRHFRSHLGLDAIAGDGGCARGQVSISDSAPLYQSPHLIGSSTATDIGTIELPQRQEKQRELVLTVDAAHDDRPSGADPLNIRDSVDWLDPTLLLDRSGMQEEVIKRRFDQIRATEGWDLVTQANKLQVLRTWDDLAPTPGQHTHAVSLTDVPLTFRRSVQIRPGQRWLVVGAWRSRNAGAPPQVQVTVDDKVVAEQEIPLRDRSHTDPQPLLLSVDEFPKDRPVSFEIAIQPGSEELPVHIETLALTSQHPKLFSILDETPANTNIRQLAPPEPKTSSRPATDPHRFVFSGNRCARAAVGAPQTITFAQPIQLRTKPRWGEYRFIRFAIRKSGGRAVLKYRHRGIDGDGSETISMHTAGPGEKLQAPTRQVRDVLPDEWIVITRDLVADFGEMDLSSLTLEVVDGEPAFIDSVYLARSNPDFAEIPRP